MDPVPYHQPRNLAQSTVWLVPTIAVSNGVDHADARWAAACLVSGIVWQLVFRRDLADRLTMICVLVAVGAVLGAGVNLAFDAHAVTESSASSLGAVLACLSGLVLTEQALRFRDLREWRRAKRAAAAAEEAVPARP